MYTNLQEKLVFIRLSEAGLNFIYTVIGSEGVEAEEEVEALAGIADGYWGGSEAVD